MSRPVETEAFIPDELVRVRRRVKKPDMVLEILHGLFLALTFGLVLIMVVTVAVLTNNWALLALFFFALMFGGVGAILGHQKGRTGLGFAWGFLVGPLGWLVMATFVVEKKK